MMKIFNKNNIFKFLIFSFFSLVTLLIVYASKQIYINSYGYILTNELRLVLTTFKLMFVIIIPVFFLTIFIIYYYRRSNVSSSYQPNWNHSYFLEIICWLIPVMIISFLANLSYKTTHKLDPSKSLQLNTNQPITIEVISLNWRWLFIYPDYKIATINEIAFPKHVPVHFNITSHSVMNSFFIPSLGSQIYTMAGMKTNLNLIAMNSGIYKGISSNYSGHGFSNMKFRVCVQNNLFSFNKWIKRIKLKKNVLFSKKQFLKLSYNSKQHHIQYFSYIDPLLFYKIIDMFNILHNV
ncbi:Cytochrome bo(3) ubiquinol oxidase subunit 2 [Buchnera aphidicola (Cinara curvipes)]|uniref:Ubiquinol oxidase subunit 2 n=2 Tax=Buchnera aphidicola TaxID=9 RepID=A0A451D730_9GAMM|nr:Cytochrome bo(3) ubiquinol oxidase subunit 2 [Buchnera aphidicola (Cinara curvipes)]